MAAEALEPLYLITGGDAPKIGVALRRLRARFDPGSIDTLAAELNDAGAAVAAANALGLFAGGERLVVVEGVEAWKKIDVETITCYAESPAPGAVLALVGDAPRLPTGLEAVCESAGKVLRYDVPKRKRGSREVDDYVAWTKRQLDQAQVRTDGGVAGRLVELVGEDAFSLQAEVEKLAAWAGDETVGVEEAEQLVVPSNDMPAWALTDAWGARDVAAALWACEVLLEHEAEPYIIAYRLSEHVRKVRAVQALVDEDVSVGEIARRLGLKSYPARKQADQARNFAPAELGEALARLAGLDHDVKGGRRLDPTLQLQRAIVEVTETPAAGTGG